MGAGGRVSKHPGMSGLLAIVLRTANPIATKEPAAAMVVGFAPGRKSATF